MRPDGEFYYRVSVPPESGVVRNMYRGVAQYLPYGTVYTEQWIQSGRFLPTDDGSRVYLSKAFDWETLTNDSMWAAFGILGHRYLPTVSYVYQRMPNTNVWWGRGGGMEGAGDLVQEYTRAGGNVWDATQKSMWGKTGYQIFYNKGGMRYLKYFAATIGIVMAIDALSVMSDFGWGYYYGGKQIVKDIGAVTSGSYNWVKGEAKGGTEFAVKKFEDVMSSTQKTLFAVIGVMAGISILKMQF